MIDDWRNEAECFGLTELFYNEGHTAAAVAVCHTCPVMFPCRYDALEWPTHEQYGVAGGLNATQRQRIRRRWEWANLDPTVMRQLRRDAHTVSVSLRTRTLSGAA